MDFTQKKKTTFKSERWYLDSEIIRRQGFLQSPLFGSERTKFFWRAEKLQTVRLSDEFIYQLHLYLAVCQEEQISVHVTFWYSNAETNTYNLLNGAVSLDKFTKIGWNSWRHPSKCFSTSTEITFEEDEYVIPRISQEKHYKTMSSQLLSLRLNSDNSADITLVTTVDGRQFPVHSNILSARSPVFAAMFGYESFTESQNRRVEIDYVCGDVMETLLDYLYTANVAKINETAGDLLLAADKYDIPLLVQACIESMFTCLSVENAAEFFYLADLHQLTDLKALVTCFISKNRQAVRNSSGWKEFIGKEQMQQLYDAFLLK